MLAFVLRRVLWIIPITLVVATITFLLMHQTPGGPWDSQRKLSATAQRNLNRKFGLDKPVWLNPAAARRQYDAGVRDPLRLTGAFLDSQYVSYLVGLAHFDLGVTYASKGAKSVRSIIAETFPISARIGLVGLAFAVLIGVPLGIVSALRQRSWLDHVSLVVSTGGIAVPTFVSGILCVVFFSRWFGLAPIRRPEEWDGFGGAYILPGLVLGLGALAYLARLTRASLLEVKHHDFVRTARAKGLAESGVVRRHLLRNALIPVVTVLGPAAADLVTGSIVIETIFNAPGLGREFVSAIAGRDYALIMGTTIFYAVVIALANVCVDLSYGFLDPRIRVSR